MVLTLAYNCADIRSTEIFQRNHGPKIIMQILNKCGQSVNLLDKGFSVIAAAATGNEIVKEAFMDFKIGELFVSKLNAQSKGCTESMYDAIRVLLTPDDERVLASQVSIHLPLLLFMVSMISNLPVVH